eukprot:4991639-Alexandrium_andersonii.AAC.1
MSASLVGSEMCIRDRTVSRGERSINPIDAGWHKKSDKPFPTTLTAASAAVSYTHLTLPTICSV